MAMIKEPTLFGAVCIEFGYLNPVLRETTNNAQAGLNELGSIKIKDQFMGIYKNDLYYNINAKVDYPSVFLTTGLNDPRVASWIPAKFFMKLKESGNKKGKHYLKVFNGGHDIIEPLEEVIFFAEHIK
jgi:prolyl oligopeptidase